MALQSNHTDPRQRNLGFQGQGFDWTKYIKYRPVYSEALYSKLYEYHQSAHASNTFDVVHDVGAGAGTVSEMLARRFKRVIVSEPNTDFLDVARARLSSTSNETISESESEPASTATSTPTPEGGGGKFTYLAEQAEESSVASGSIDMVVISEAIHWTDIPATIDEFARQLKSNGTLCIIFYGQVWITDNAAAQGVWEALFADVVRSAFHEDGSGSGSGSEGREKKNVYWRAGRNTATGLDNVHFPSMQWKEGVLRTFTNTGGDRRRLGFAEGFFGEDEDRVGEGDRRVFVEEDEDWLWTGCDLEFLQGIFTSFVPGTKVEDYPDRWEQLERALGGRERKVTVAWPNVQILATRK